MPLRRGRGSGERVPRMMRMCWSWVKVNPEELGDPAPVTPGTLTPILGMFPRPGTQLLPPPPPPPPVPTVPPPPAARRQSWGKNKKC